MHVKMDRVCRQPTDLKTFREENWCQIRSGENWLDDHLGIQNMGSDGYTPETHDWGGPNITYKRRIAFVSTCTTDSTEFLDNNSFNSA